MRWNTGPVVPSRSAAALDELAESWVCWREACEDVRGAYEHWATCARPQRHLAFAGYRAALDREDHAARVYCVLTDKLCTGTR